MAQGRNELTDTSSQQPSRVRFAHGVALAAAVPYVVMMAALGSGIVGLAPEERAFLEFMTLIVAFAGVPVFLGLTVLVFGLALLVLQGARITTVHAYAAWGAGAALILFLVMALAGPRAQIADELPALALFLLVGAAAGAAFRTGALRARRDASRGRGDVP